MDETIEDKEKPTKQSFFIKNVLITIITTLLVLWVVDGYPSPSSSTESLTNNQTQSEDLSLIVDNERQAIPDIVELVSPAVVSVVISAEVPIIERYYEDYNPFGRGFNFSIPQQRQIGTEKREIGGGSGFFVSLDGFIVTNRHVVDIDDAEYSIVTNDGESYEVEVIAKDTMLDIAILKAKADKEFSYLEFGNSSEARLGSTVIAIGNALAEFPNSVSVGVVSGLSRNIMAGDNLGFVETLEGVIQTDAAINQGNSGGPLLNTAGEVIGVNVAVAGNGENIGFALPSDSVAGVFQSVAEFGEIVRPFVGVRYLQINEMVAEQNDLEVNYGVLIIRGNTPADLAVLPGSPANKASLEEGDIILEVEGERLDGEESFASMIRSFEVGQTISFKVLHNGEEKNVSVTLDRAPVEQ